MDQKTVRRMEKEISKSPLPRSFLSGQTMSFNALSG